jgi:hypothetical protein
MASGLFNDRAGSGMRQDSKPPCTDRLVIMEIRGTPEFVATFGI